MPWISNRTGVDIRVSITNDSGGNTETFLVPPAILYKTATATAPEISGNNYWTRTDSESLIVSMGDGTYSIPVQANDHVNIYTDSYETYPARFGWFGNGPGNNGSPVY
ncbi:hypothetical protein F5887DRAFT_1081233 [Amanita rubescens]|nr:hypothetical protein F5887DRAFT_1081233 [Amanita rubescens]